MKKIILTFLVLCSCSKKAYYEYEKIEYNEKNQKIIRYSTIETKSNKSIIFRSFSENLSNKQALYMNIKEEYYLVINDSIVSFCNYCTSCNYVNDFDKNEWRLTILSCPAPANTYGIEYSKTTDSLILDENCKKFIDTDKGLERANIKWFPPYFVKVKKLNVSKFYSYNDKLKKLKNL